MFDLLVVHPLTNLLLGFYILLGNNLGWAIIVFTIVLRIILLPLTIKQIQTQKKMQELQPKIQALQSQRKDPTQMTPEEMALMRQTAGSCLGGVIPIAIQIPILIGLNMVINQIASVNSDASKGGDFFNNVLYFDFLKHSPEYLFNTNFLGFDLAGIPAQITHDWSLLPYGVLIALLVITQFIQSKIINSVQKKSQEKLKKNKPNQKKLTKEEQEKMEMQEALNKWTQMQMVYFIPVMIGVGAYSFPAALGIYWLVQNIFAILQTIVQYRHADGKLSIESVKEDIGNFLSRFRNKQDKKA